MKLQEPVAFTDATDYFVFACRCRGDDYLVEKQNKSTLQILQQPSVTSYHTALYKKSQLTTLSNF